MTTDAKPVQGRHRAMTDARSGLQHALRPLLLRGWPVAVAAAVVVAAVLTWQVV
jgi:hypothetical protein